MNLERKATLIPKFINLRIEDNVISIEYRIKDEFSGIGIGNTWLNFEPSEELMQKFKEEIDKAMKNKK